MISDCAGMPRRVRAHRGHTLASRATHSHSASQRGLEVGLRDLRAPGTASRPIVGRCEPIAVAAAVTGVAVSLDGVDFMGERPGRYGSDSMPACRLDWMAMIATPSKAIAIAVTMLIFSPRRRNPVGSRRSDSSQARPTPYQIR